MSDNEKDVRFNTKMSKRLRDDAKRNCERGELSDAIRDLFRRKAYGEQGTTGKSEVEKVRAELREVRRHIDDLRKERADIENEIESQERRQARLEERLDNLEREKNELDQTLQTLENMLQSGERMWPTKVKNAADVDRGTAEKLYQQLKDRNDELPAAAFEEPGVHTPSDWRDVQ